MDKHYTSQPRKQRLQRYNAPHHVARKQMASHLSNELLVKYNRRALTVIRDDEVKVLRGDHKGKSGKIVEVDVKARKVIVQGVTIKKADGTDVPLPVDPSNLQIIKLNLEDKLRRAKLEGNEEAAKKGEAGKPKERPSKQGKPAKKPAAKAAKAESKSEPKGEGKTESPKEA